MYYACINVCSPARIELEAIALYAVQARKFEGLGNHAAFAQPVVCTVVQSAHNSQHGNAIRHAPKVPCQSSIHRILRSETLTIIQPNPVPAAERLILDAANAEIWFNPNLSSVLPTPPEIDSQAQ